MTSQLTPNPLRVNDRYVITGLVVARSPAGVVFFPESPTFPVPLLLSCAVPHTVPRCYITPYSCDILVSPCLISVTSRIRKDLDATPRKPPRKIGLVIIINFEPSLVYLSTKETRRRLEASSLLDIIHSKTIECKGGDDGGEHVTCRTRKSCPLL